jgi:hypothetical protein
MNIVLLNWGKGENNPFTYLNPPKEETSMQINILRDVMAYSKLFDYKVFYQIIDALVADILLGGELSNGEAKSIGDFFKVREYSDKIDEIKV